MASSKIKGRPDHGPAIGDAHASQGLAQPPPGLDFRSTRLVQFLPPIYHTDFVERFLAIFEATLTPIEWNVDNFDLFLDPRTAPAAFLQWLAGWYAIIFDDGWSDTQRRLMLTEAHRLFARRGTKYSLGRILEIYTGETPEINDTGEDQPPDTFTVRIRGERDETERIRIENLIESNKPAHTYFRLIFTPK